MNEESKTLMNEEGIDEDEILNREDIQYFNMPRRETFPK